MKLGAQFYTLRDKCTTLECLSESLKRVADIGYTTVQLSGICGYEPEWMNEELKKNGLECVLTHWSPEEIKTSPLEVIERHKKIGCNYIGIGCMPGWTSEENLEKFIRDFKEPAKILAENGCKLFYHNHQGEFAKCKDGEMIFDKLLKAFTPEELGITLDTYWVQVGGGDTCEWLEKLRGRVECIHLKDLEIVDKDQRMAPIGNGSMNFKKIVKTAENVGVKYLLVEQDDCYGKDPFECLKTSYEYLKSLGLK